MLRTATYYFFFFFFLISKKSFHILRGVLKRFIACNFKISQKNAALIASIFAPTKEDIVAESKGIFVSKCKRDATRKMNRVIALRAINGTPPDTIDQLLAEIRVLELLQKNPCKIMLLHFHLYYRRSFV